MHRRTLLAALALAPFAARTAFAQESAAPLSYDDGGRPLAPVRLNGGESAPLVIDTAAGGTLLSATTIATLGLQPSGARVHLHGASGMTETDLYMLSSIEIAGLRRERQHAVQTPANAQTAAQHAGVLAANVFAGTRLTFDFSANLLRVDAAAARAPLSGAAPIVLRHGVFVFAPITIAGVAAQALIDTGAQRTVANPALREALGVGPTDPRLREADPVRGATHHHTPAQAAELGPLTLAGRTFSSLDLTFAQLAVFRPMQINDEPAAIVGMDILRRARALTIDYAASQMVLAV